MSGPGGGVRHVSVLTFVDGTSDEQVSAIEAALAGLPGETGVILDYHYGRDLGIDDGNHHFVVIADFASAEDYATYRDHPAHRAVLAELIRPVLATRAAVQYSI